MQSDTDRRLDIPWLSGVLLRTGPVVLLLIPVLGLVQAYRDDLLAFDFKQAFLPAAERLLDGDSPYPELGYPPLVAFLSVPFALAPATEILVTLAVAACVPASLWILGVRDWRCYVVAFLWAPVFHSIQTANVTLPLLLAAGACWRWRESVSVPAVAGGLAVATKIIAWPLAFWLAVSRRLKAAVGVVVVAGVVTLGLWAVLGFSGLVDYPRSLDRLQGAQDDRGYTFQALAGDAGVADEIGVVAAAACLALVLFLVLFYARRGDEARSFASAAVAMIAASPIIWLHSFAILLAPVAVLRPRLSAVWFLPVVLLLVSEGTGNGAPWQTVLTLAVAVLVVVIVLRDPRPLDAWGSLGERRSSGAVGGERS